MRKTWVIVGGGPQGAHLAASLLQSRGLPLDRIAVVDPAERLLHGWRTRTAAVHVRHLRSPHVQNIDVDPHSLLEFTGRSKSFGPACLPCARRR